MKALRKMAISTAGCFAALAVDAQEKWSYEMMPYVWMAGLDGRVGMGPVEGDIAGSFQDLRDLLNVGLTLRMSARRAPVTWFIEANYLGYGIDSAVASTATHVGATQTFGEAGLSYEFNSALALYGGVRAQQIDFDTVLAGERHEDSQAWLDGMVGVQWTQIASDHWTAWVRADAGGGGSNFVWLAEAGGGYRWTNRWSVYAAYRVLDTSYDHSSFIYDMRRSGLMFGLGAQF